MYSKNLISLGKKSHFSIETTSFSILSNEKYLLVFKKVPRTKNKTYTNTNK